MTRAVFLDRDGTLIEDKNYLDTPEGVEWFDGAFEALGMLSEAGYRLVMITNQSGVARGYMTEGDVRAIHDRIESDLAERGLAFDGIYYCPYLEDGDVDEYARDSRLRKPSPGMLHDARDELNLTLENSWIVGDKLSDVETGVRAGCSTVLVRTGKGNSAEQDVPERDFTPDAVVDGIRDAAEAILERTSGENGG